MTWRFQAAGPRGNPQPRKGGVLKFGNAGGSPEDNLDLRKITDGVVVLAAFATYNLLVEVDDHGKATPELAESWEARPDAVSWIFNIRKGVTFHNGKELDADDVIYSLNLHRGDSASGAKSTVSGIKDIRKVNNHQLEFTLHEPNADLAYTLSDFHLMIVPAGWTDRLKPVGTGAFSVEHFKSGGEQPEPQAKALLELGATGVLVKGGDGVGDMSIDRLFQSNLPTKEFASPRLNATLRGTGCMLASAIAANLSLGKSHHEACSLAKGFVSRKLQQAASEIC